MNKQFSRVYHFPNYRKDPLHVGDLVVHDSAKLRRAEESEDYDGQVIQATGGFVLVSFIDVASHTHPGVRKARPLASGEARKLQAYVDRSVPGKAFGPFQGALQRSAGFVEVTAKDDTPFCCLSAGDSLYIYTPATMLDRTAHVPYNYLDLPYPPCIDDVVGAVDRTLAMTLLAVCQLPYQRKVWKSAKEVSGRDWLADWGKTHVLFTQQPLQSHYNFEVLPHPIGVLKESVSRMVGYPVLVDTEPQRCLLPVLLLLKLTKDATVRVSSSLLHEIRRMSRFGKLET